MAIIEHKFEIGFRDVGRSKLTNRALLGFLEDIAGIHSNIAGFGLNDIKQTGYTWILLNWKVKIIKRPKYGDTILVKTWARDIERFFTYRDFEVYNNNNELIAIATSKWVLMDAKTMSLTKITDEVMEHYNMETKKVFNNEPEPSKISIPKDFSSVVNYTVQRKDIDINKHVHNVYYLDIAYEALPQDVYDNISFNSFEIMYKKETKLGETIKCFYTKIDKSHYIVMKSEDEKFLHCIVKLNENS